MEMNGSEGVAWRRGAVQVSQGAAKLETLISTMRRGGGSFLAWELRQELAAKPQIGRDLRGYLSGRAQVMSPSPAVDLKACASTSWSCWRCPRRPGFQVSERPVALK